MIIVHIPGEPEGKGRARSAVIKHGPLAGKIRHYTPTKTRSYEDKVAWWSKAAMKGRPPLACAVTLTIHARRTVPKSYSKKDTAEALAGRTFPTQKPDLDNIEKAVLDGMNGIVWVDDAQVVTVVKTKRYSDQPEVIVTIDEQFPV